jgi:hypothetical protein
VLPAFYPARHVPSIQSQSDVIIELRICYQISFGAMFIAELRVERDQGNLIKTRARR